MTDHAGPDVAALARDAFRRADFTALGDLVAKHPLEFWFTVPPSESYAMLAAVPHAKLRRHPTAHALLRILSGSALDSDLGADTQEVAVHGGMKRFEQGITLGQATQTRLAGDPVRAFTMMRRLRAVAAAVPFLMEGGRGERTFALVQTAISGMLAGRQAEALALFEKSLVPPLPTALRFLTRDALVRSAMIHALYGDPRRAQINLERAREVPRTRSWVEDILDTDERLVVALLRPREEAQLAFEEASSTSIAQMHELWPLHVVGIGYLGILADRREDARRRLQEIEDAELAQLPGAGLTGSVLAMEFALDALLSGAVGRAQQLLEGADKRMWRTKVLLALTAVGGGAHARAIQLARSASTHTRHLPQAEASRLAVIALAHHGRGDASAAISALSAVPDPGLPLAIGLVRRFSPELLALAAERLSAWSAAPGAVAPSPTEGPVAFEELLLTDRELEMLTGIAAGRSREEIARDLFLSVNTVKTHQRSLYRKLGASTAGEALAEGRRRGLI